MNNNLPRQTVLLAGILAVCASMASNVASAIENSEQADSTKASSEEKPNWTTSDGLLSAVGLDPNKSSFMTKHNLKFGGWVNTSVSGNTNASPDRFNGPVTFNDRSGEVHMNQLNLYFQKAITASGDAFDIGGRVDFMYGSDSVLTQAYGVPTFDLGTGRALNRGNWDLHLARTGRFYSLAIPQAYAEFNLPVGNGLTVKAGHFYTPLGYEVVTAPDNFFQSFAYTFQYGEPFTHTGVLGSYTINPNWSVMAGPTIGSATGGWDGNFNAQMGNVGFLGGATWTSDDTNSSINLTSTAGQRSETSSAPWAIYSIVAKHNFTDKLHYVFQHDHGFANNVMTANTLINGGHNENAQWYGINQYIFYDINNKLSAGLRAEWWDDPNGFRLAGPARCGAGLNSSGSSYTCPNGSFYPPAIGGSNYYEVTAGLKYTPVKFITLRPNIRYDWADLPQYDSGKRSSQFLISFAATLMF